MRVFLSQTLKTVSLVSPYDGRGSCYGFIALGGDDTSQGRKHHVLRN